MAFLPDPCHIPLGLGWRQQHRGGLLRFAGSWCGPDSRWGTQTAAWDRSQLHVPPCLGWDSFSFSLLPFQIWLWVAILENYCVGFTSLKNLFFWTMFLLCYKRDKTKRFFISVNHLTSSYVFQKPVSNSYYIIKDTPEHAVNWIQSKNEMQSEMSRKTKRLGGKSPKH